MEISIIIAIGVGVLIFTLMLSLLIWRYMRGRKQPCKGNLHNAEPLVDVDLRSSMMSCRLSGGESVETDQHVSVISGQESDDDFEQGRRENNDFEERCGENNLGQGESSFEQGDEGSWREEEGSWREEEGAGIRDDLLGREDEGLRPKDKGLMSENDRLGQENPGEQCLEQSDQGGQLVEQHNQGEQFIGDQATQTDITKSGYLKRGGQALYQGTKLLGSGLYKVGTNIYQGTRFVAPLVGSGIQTSAKTVAPLIKPGFAVARGITTEACNTGFSATKQAFNIGKVKTGELMASSAAKSAKNAVRQLGTIAKDSLKKAAKDAVGQVTNAITCAASSAKKTLTNAIKGPQIHPQLEYQSLGSRSGGKQNMMRETEEDDDMDTVDQGNENKQSQQQRYTNEAEQDKRPSTLPMRQEKDKQVRPNKKRVSEDDQAAAINRILQKTEEDAQRALQQRYNQSEHDMRELGFLDPDTRNELEQLASTARNALNVSEHTGQLYVRAQTDKGGFDAYAEKVTTETKNNTAKKNAERVVQAFTHKVNLVNVARQAPGDEID